jgi:hypothetical protein
LFCPLDVAVLSRFVAAAQNQHNRPAGLLVVNSVSRTISQAHFANAFTNRLDVSSITEAKSFNSRDDLRNGPLIRESGKPAIEFIGLLNFEHMYLIGYIPTEVNAQATRHGT